jgi:predicted dithiol-disulfide oxidoreductase (DUF899 family)
MPAADWTAEWTADWTAARPEIADRATYEHAITRLRKREKAHTREGDQIAAERRRLPMVELDPATPLTGDRGQTTLLDAFEGRRQMVAYFHMWNPGRPAAEQCEGCSFFNGHMRELSYLHSRDVTYLTVSDGPWSEISRYRDFLGLEMAWYSVAPGAVRLLGARGMGMLAALLRIEGRVFETWWTTGRGVEAAFGGSYALLDRTVYGRQETWEESPMGWPQRFGADGDNLRVNGRPTLQWSRLAADADDDLGADEHGTVPTPGGCH